MRTGTSLVTGAFASASAEKTRHAAHISGVAVRLSDPPRPNVGDICEVIRWAFSNVISSPHQID
jgi:hypothetical protein